MSGTQSGNWLRGHCPARRKLRCKGKRPVCRRRRLTGACETCGAAANAFQQVCRSLVGKRPELAIRSTAEVRDREAFRPLRQSDLMGRGIRDAVLFLYATSLSYEDAPVGWYSVPGIGMPGETRPCASMGFGSGWGVARETRERLSMGEDRARSNAPSPTPDGRSDQPQSPDGCPATGGISPGH